MAATTVYVRKKEKENLSVCDFSTALNHRVSDHYYPLQYPEEIFTKLNGEENKLNVGKTWGVWSVFTDEIKWKLCKNFDY